MSNTNDTNSSRIIYKVTCSPTSKVYVATSRCSNPIEAFNKFYHYTQRDKDILTESELSDIVVDILKYDISRFKVELLDDKVPINETAFLKLQHVKNLAKELGEEHLYNNIDNGNRKNSNKKKDPSVKHTYYAIVSKHFFAITIFEDRYSELLKAIRNKRSKYYEYNQNSINTDMFDTYNKALVFVRKQLKILTGNMYDENTIKRLCMEKRMPSVYTLSSQAMVLGYFCQISSQQYSDMLQEQRRIKTEKSMREILEILNSNRL